MYPVLILLSHTFSMKHSMTHWNKHIFYSYCPMRHSFPHNRYNYRHNTLFYKHRLFYWHSILDSSAYTYTYCLYCPILCNCRHNTYNSVRNNSYYRYIYFVLCSMCYSLMYTYIYYSCYPILNWLPHNRHNSGHNSLYHKRRLFPSNDYVSTNTHICSYCCSMRHVSRHNNHSLNRSNCLNIHRRFYLYSKCCSVMYKYTDCFHHPI